MTSKCNVKTIENQNLSAYEVAVKRGFHQLANEIKFVGDIYSTLENRSCNDFKNSTRDSQPVNVIRNYAKTRENSKKYYSIKEEENAKFILDSYKKMLEEEIEILNENVKQYYVKLDEEKKLFYFYIK